MQFTREEILNSSAIKKYNDNIFAKNVKIFIEEEIENIIRQILTFPNKLRIVYPMVNIINKHMLTKNCVKLYIITQEQLKNTIDLLMDQLQKILPDSQITIDYINSSIIIEWK